MTDRERFTTALTRAAAALDIRLTPEMLDAMFAHHETVIVTNARFNLTRITEPASAAVKLFADSLAPLAWSKSTGVGITSMLDVGTGAGFPAVPLAITRPDWQVTAIDSTGKKATFVRNAAKTIGIANLRAEHARAEQWRASTRFDLITLKAVGPLKTCVQIAQKLIGRDGHIAVFKSAKISHDEIDDGQRAAESLGMSVWDVYEYELPLADDLLQSALFVFRRFG